VELVANGAEPRTFEVLVRSHALATGAPGLIIALREVTKERSVERRLELQERLAGIGQLTAGIAHDFNNLLQGIEMDAERVLGIAGVPAAVVEAQTAIVERARRGACLVRQILDFRRTLTMTRELTSLATLVREDIALLKRTLPESIEVVLEPGDVDLQIECDPTQIQRAIANLAINARDAMPAGGKLCIKLSKLVLGGCTLPPTDGLRSGAWARLCVRDTGVGIPFDVQPHILEPFFTTKPPGVGTGLGLPQVYGIMTQHGGFMEFSSRPGEGSTFSLYFPLPDTNVPANKSHAEPLDSARPGNGEAILVVEDNRELLQLIAGTLSSLGYQPVGTSSGDHAVELYKQTRQRFDLVISDLLMPGMSGLDLSAELAAIDSDSRILIMSGHSQGGELATGHANVVGWMTKPFSIAALGSAVSWALTGRGMRRPAVSAEAGARYQES
jgi:signal transduction histidine kinase/ActR/RegA family two-component response regulator